MLNPIEINSGSFPSLVQVVYVVVKTTTTLGCEPKLYQKRSEMVLVLVSLRCEFDLKPTQEWARGVICKLQLNAFLQPRVEF